FWCSEPVCSARWFDWVGERFRPTRLVTAAAAVPLARGGSRWDGWGRCRLPAGPAAPWSRPVLLGESARPARQTQPPDPPPRPHPLPQPATADLRRAARVAARDRRQAEECARLAALPVPHARAAGIDVGDLTHRVRVEATPTAPTRCA